MTEPVNAAVNGADNEAVNAADNEADNEADNAAHNARPTLSAAVTRELLRTPAFRELIRINLRGDWEAGAAELAEALVNEDPEVALAAVTSLPRAINALARALAQTGRAAQRYTPALLSAYAAQLWEELDTEALAEVGAVYGGIARRLLLEDDEARAALLRWAAGRINSLARTAAQTLEAQEQQPPEQALLASREIAVHLLGSMDFGLLRRAAEAASRETLRRAPALLDEALGDPALLANLLELGPPLLNAAAGLTAQALEAVKLPPEVLASGVLNLLRELDTSRLAALIDAVSRTIQSLHAGSLLLGRHEPRLRVVLATLVDELSERVDHDAAAGAALALAEDARTALQVLAAAAVRDPRLLSRAVAAGLKCAGALSRGVADALEALDRLPDVALDDLGQALERGADEANDATPRLVNAAVKLAERLLARREDLPRRLLGPLQASVDREALARLAARLSGPLWRAAQGALAGLEPADPAGLAAAALTAYAENLQREPRLFSEAVARTDPELLQRAVQLSGAQIELLLREHPHLAQQLLQPLISRLPALALDYVKTRLLPSNRAESNRARGGRR